jgi:hypothetical protein
MEKVGIMKTTGFLRYSASILFFPIDNVCGFFCELTVHMILNGVDQLKDLIRRKGKLLISFFRLRTEVANHYMLMLY